MGRLEDLRVNAYLSKVARGYSNNAFIADVLFPEIYEDSEKVDIFEFNKEAFSIYNTDRAIRANSNVISPKGFNKKSVTLQEHDLVYPMDYREIKESSVIKLNMHATNVVTEGLKLKYEKQCADLVQDISTYESGNRITLAGGDKFSEYTTSDPIGVIDDAKEAVSSKIAKEANTMVIGAKVWKKLKRHPALKGILASTKDQLVSENLLKDIFEIETVKIGRGVFIDDNNVQSDIWGNNIILAYTSKLDSRTQYDPAFAYTVKKKNALVIDEYDSQGNKVKNVRATDIYSPFIVGPEAGYLINNVIAEEN